jgi:DNA repair photolyase
VEDLDLLARFPRAAVGFSVPTDDDRVRRAFEPGADPIEERVAALAACHAAGVRTFAIVQPMLPMDAARLVDLLAPHIEVLRLDRMHGIERVRHLYEAAGALAASTDEFFKTTGEALRRGFAARGIPVDDLDDMAGLVGPARAVGGPPAPGPGPRRPRGRAR